MFTGYLSAQDIEQLTQAALSGDVLDFDRALWFEHVPKGFVHSLRISPQPLLQFRLDLAKLNSVERLEDGSVPLQQVLTNIAGLLRAAGRPEAAVFEFHANRSGNRAQGVRAPVPVTGLPEVVRKEAIVHQDDSVAFGFLASALAVGRSVGRISVPRFESGRQILLATGSPWVTNGTAWLIADDLVITNHHVVNARRDDEPNASAVDLDQQASSSTVAFDLDNDESETQTMAVGGLEVLDEDLDYAVLRLAAPAPGRRPLALCRQLVTMNASTYLPVNIIQHPNGRPKRIAFRNNLLSGADANILRYFTDTDFGSSGAPVCDDTWRVIALHRGAEQASGVRFQGKDTAFVNFGSQIMRVLEDIERRHPEIRAEIDGI